MKTKPCFFAATDEPGRFECQRCGYRARSPFAADRIVRACTSMDRVEGEESSLFGIAPTYAGWFGMAGLGDIIRLALMAVGITPEARAVKWLVKKEGKGCGCKSRQAKLNAAVPFNWPLLLARIKSAFKPSKLLTREKESTP